MRRGPKKKIDPETNPIGADGRLCYPPKKYRYMQDEEDRILAEKEMEKRKRNEVPGIVEIEDLLTGEYRKKKQQQEMIRKKERRMKRKLLRVEIDYIPDEIK